jgi:two-component system chemotaxis response regulator CheB
MSTSPIRVLVIEDSLTVRKRLIEVLEIDPNFVVVGEGVNGKDAIELCQQHRPDVISMDMMMPLMTGLTATEYLMAYCPTPILIVSASVNRQEALRTLDALAAGAVDVLDKPGAEDDGGRWERQYLSTLRIVSRVRVITHPKAKLGGWRPPSSEAPKPFESTNKVTSHELIAIGASTGGPQAMMQLLPALPRDFYLPILLVMHIDVRFDVSFREWLDGISDMPVRHAVHDEPLPKPGQRGIWLAPAERHLIVEHDRLRLISTRERNSCRPSVDELFESLARELGPRAIACQLTGMGADGAAGLLAMRQAGSLTLAQDEATSVVFGMPAEAIKRGAAQRVLPLQEFAPVLTQLASAAKTSRKITK